MEDSNSIADRYEAAARAMKTRAEAVIDESGIRRIWREAGCRVNLVGAARMGLMATHRDIDLHVYSPAITEASSFAVAARMAALPGVQEIRCINGLATDERCIAWHVSYLAANGEPWKFDIIHIVEGSRYDGFFEQMADRIVAALTPETRAAILRLKFEAPEDAGYHGVEFYEAVIADGIRTLPAFAAWVTARRTRPPYYWLPD